MLWIGVPVLLACLGMAFSDLGGAATAILMVTMPFLVFGHWVINHARLILSPVGLKCRQFGSDLQTRWDNIDSVRLDPGREGFVCRDPLGGQGPKRIAATRSHSLSGVPNYHEEVLVLLAEGRFLPIDAYAYAIRDGQMIESISKWAPDLAVKIRRELGSFPRER